MATTLHRKLNSTQSEPVTWRTTGAEALVNRSVHQMQNVSPGIFTGGMAISTTALSADGDGAVRAAFQPDRS